MKQSFGKTNKKKKHHLPYILGKLCFICSAALSLLLCLAPANVSAGGGSPAENHSKSGVMVTIDANRKYEGMNAPFSKGYEPSIKKDVMSLVIPFRVGQETGGSRILVGISFEREENSPFYYKNYQKKVKESEEGIYLYQCKIQLKENRVNGQYPLHLFVQAQTQGEHIQQEFTIYVEITDGKPKPQTGNQAGNHSGPEGSGSVAGDGMGDSGSGSTAGDGMGGSSSGSAAGDGMGGSGSGSIEGDSDGGSGNGGLAGDGISDGGEMGSMDSPNGTSQPSGSWQKEEASRQPKVIIHANSLQNTPLQAGSQMFWSVSAKNCSSNRSIENLKVTILSEQKDISFEKTAWYFEQAGAGASMDLSQNITIGIKAASGPVQIQFQFEYEDKQGTAYTSTETATLTVVQEPKAELAGLTFPESIYESDTDLLTFQVQNSGLAPIYNAKVHLEGKGLFPEKELFLGTIEAGTSTDGEISVFAGNLCMDNEGNIIEEHGEKYGDTLCTVIFSYENEQGEVSEQKQELKTSIKKPQIVELKVEKEAPKTNQWWITIIILILIVLILIICWLYLRMSYYRKRADSCK